MQQTLSRIGESTFSARCQLPSLMIERTESSHKIGVLESQIWQIESQAHAEDSIDQAEPETATKKRSLEHLKMVFGSVNETIKKF